MSSRQEKNDANDVNSLSEEEKEWLSMMPIQINNVFKYRLGDRYYFEGKGGSLVLGFRGKNEFNGWIILVNIPYDLITSMTEIRVQGSIDVIKAYPTRKFALARFTGFIKYDIVKEEDENEGSSIPLLRGDRKGLFLIQGKKKTYRVQEEITISASELGVIKTSSIKKKEIIGEKETISTIVKALNVYDKKADIFYDKNIDKAKIGELPVRMLYPYFVDTLNYKPFASINLINWDDLMILSKALVVPLYMIKLASGKWYYRFLIGGRIKDVVIDTKINWIEARLHNQDKEGRYYAMLPVKPLIALNTYQRKTINKIIRQRIGEGNWFIEYDSSKIISVLLKAKNKIEEWDKKGKLPQIHLTPLREFFEIFYERIPKKFEKKLKKAINIAKLLMEKEIKFKIIVAHGSRNIGNYASYDPYFRAVKIFVQKGKLKLRPVAVAKTRPDHIIIKVDPKEFAKKLGILKFYEWMLLPKREKIIVLHHWIKKAHESYFSEYKDRSFKEFEEFFKKWLETHEDETIAKIYNALESFMRNIKYIDPSKIERIRNIFLVALKNGSIRVLFDETNVITLEKKKYMPLDIIRFAIKWIIYNKSMRLRDGVSFKIDEADKIIDLL